MNPLYQKSEWCQAGTIEHFEKMARFHGAKTTGPILIKLEI